MSISTCCPISDAESRFLRAGACQRRPYSVALPTGLIGCYFTPRLVHSVYVFVNGFITIGALALLALVSRNPFVFPSLGPTAYLLFFTPLGRTSSPRNTVFGHAIGLICGYVAFITGAGALPFGVHPGIFWPRILAAALSLSATGALMVLLDASHPPAGAQRL